MFTQYKSPSTDTASSQAIFSATMNNDINAINDILGKEPDAVDSLYDDDRYTLTKIGKNIKHYGGEIVSVGLAVFSACGLLSPKNTANIADRDLVNRIMEKLRNKYIGQIKLLTFEFNF